MELTTSRPDVVLRSFEPSDGAAFAAGDPSLDFGIHEAGVLVGSVTPVLGEPPKYGLGYLFAAITHGSKKSVAVLLRPGFSRVASFDDYDRYHLDLVRCSGIRQVLG